MIDSNRRPEGDVHEMPPPPNFRFSGDRAGGDKEYFAAKPSPGFRLLSLSEILSRPAIEWLIEEVLPKDATGVLYGGPGLGKTFVAIEWGMCVATGTDWCGRRVSPGVVLYVAAEGTRGLAQRLKAWAGPRLNDPKNAVFTNFLVLPQEVNFLDEESFAALLAAIEKMPVKPVLIVIDTLARCMVGGDENTSQHMGLFLNGCDRLRKLTGASVLVVHHSTKKGNSERGSSALRGGADTMIEIAADDSGLRKLSCDKQKDASEFEPFYFALRQVPVGEAEEEKSATSCVVDWTPAPSGTEQQREEEKETGRKDADAEICRVLREQFPDGATGPELIEATGLKDATFYRHLTKLEQTGTVEEVPGSKPTRYRHLAGNRQSHSHSHAVSGGHETETGHSHSQSRAPVGGETGSEAETGAESGLFVDEGEGGMPDAH